MGGGGGGINQVLKMTSYLDDNNSNRVGKLNLTSGN